MNANEYLDANFARKLLFKLGESLASRGMKAEIALYGGSSLLFAIEDRKTTKDIDYLNIGEANDELERMSAEIASDYNLSKNWFSDVTEVIASENPDYVFLGDFPPNNPGLRVFAASPEYVLAMKLKSPRSSLEGNDIRDIWFILKHCGITEAKDALDNFKRFFPYEELSERDVAILQDILDSQKKGEEYDPMIGW